MSVSKEIVHTKYVVPEYNIIDIVSRMEEDQWTLEEAQFWADRLEKRGFVVTDVYEFHADVKAEFLPFHKRMIAFFEEGR